MSGVEIVPISKARPRTAKKATAAKRSPRKAASPSEPRYVARRAMTIGTRRIKPGDDVPEAASWLRVESWLRSGYLERVGG